MRNFLEEITRKNMKITVNKFKTPVFCHVFGPDLVQIFKKKKKNKHGFKKKKFWCGEERTDPFLSPRKNIRPGRASRKTLFIYSQKIRLRLRLETAHTPDQRICFCSASNAWCLFGHRLPHDLLGGLCFGSSSDAGGDRARVSGQVVGRGLHPQGHCMSAVQRSGHPWTIGDIWTADCTMDHPTASLRHACLRPIGPPPMQTRPRKP